MRSVPPRPPAVAQRLAAFALPADVQEHLLGDLDEQFFVTLGASGVRAARRRYWRQVLAIVWQWPIRSTIHIQSPPFNRESLMSALLHDLRFAGRQLLRQPSYLAVAVLSLALTIAANGIVFGMVNGLVLNPFHYPDADRLVSIGSAFPSIGADQNFIEQHATADIEAFATIPVIEKVGAFDMGNRVLSYGQISDRLFTALILRDPSPAIGVPLTMGRTFTAEELAPGGPKVALLSHRIWVRLFGADPGVLNATMRVNNDPTTIIGILGEGVPLLGTDLWIPWGGDPASLPRDYRPFTVIARLKADASMSDLKAALPVLSDRAKATAAAEYPEYGDWRLSAATWSEAVTGELFQAGALLMAAGGIVLLVACVNLASLLLARLATRERELAVRRALGATAWRIARLLTMESLIVAGVAAVVGIVLARAGLSAVPALLPDRVAMVGFDLSMNATVVVYCVCAAFIAAMLTVLLPAWQLRRSVTASLADANRATSGPARQRGRRALIVTEVALAVTLLVSAGLFMRSYNKISAIDPGFNPSHLLTMRLTIDPRTYPGDQTAAFFNELAGRLSALPGVEGAAAVNQLPTASGFDINFTVEGQPVSGPTPSALLTVGSPNLFDVMGVPMASGRALTDRDRSGTPSVVVVNEAFTRRYLNGATSGRLHLGDEGIEVEIVGVVKDLRNRGIVAPVQPEIFATLDQAGMGNNQYFMAVRTAGDPLALLPSVKQAAAALDPNAPIYYVQTMDDLMATDVFPQRLAMMLVGVFAVGALVVALVGVYGLIAHWVVARRREMGIRLALGGSSRQVVGLVVGQAARLLAMGAVLGLVGGIAAGYAAAALLFATTPLDPWALGGVISVLVVTGVVASILPARRAISVSPIEVLRTE